MIRIWTDDDIEWDKIVLLLAVLIWLLIFGLLATWPAPERVTPRWVTPVEAEEVKFT